MLDCVECHDTSKIIPAEFRMIECTTCHADTAAGLNVPASHVRNVKPAFHTATFRDTLTARKPPLQTPSVTCATRTLRRHDRQGSVHRLPSGYEARFPHGAMERRYSRQVSPRLTAPLARRVTQPIIAADAIMSCLGAIILCPSSREAGTQARPCSISEPVSLVIRSRILARSATRKDSARRPDQNERPLTVRS